MRASGNTRVMKHNRKMQAAWRRVLGGQEEVDLDQGKTLQAAAGNESCPGRQRKMRDINQNHTEHISIGKMPGILDSQQLAKQLKMCRDPPKATGLQGPAGYS